MLYITTKFWPDGIESPIFYQLHIFFHKAPVRIKLVLSRDPRRSLHNYINAMEVSLSIVAIHKAMCGRIDMNASRSWIS